MSKEKDLTLYKIYLSEGKQHIPCVLAGGCKYSKWLEKKITELEQQKAELVELFDNFINEIKSACFKAEHPQIDNSHQVDTRELSKKCTLLHIKINKYKGE